MTESAIDALDFVNESGRHALHHLGQKLGTGDVVLFAGAGLSRNARATDGGVNRMPTWNALAGAFLRELDEETRRAADVLKAADYYESTYGRPALINLVERVISDRWHEPGRVHRCIAELNFREIVTTNYDTLLERGFASLHLAPQVVVTGTDLVNRRSPRVIKMNGCIDRNAAGIVITTDDFLAYPTREPLIEAFVMRCFVESRVLFVGFGLNDPTFRTINERVRRLLGNQCPTSYSLHFHATEPEIRYWRDHDVELISLASAGDAAFDGEERLHRLLRALLSVQRSATAFSQSSPRIVAAAVPVDVPHAIAALLHVAPALDRQALDEQLAADPALKGVLGLVFATISDSRAAGESATLRFLRDAVGLSDAAPVAIDAADARALRRFAELLLAGAGTNRAVRADIMTTALLLALQLVYAGDGCVEAERRLFRAARMVPEDIVVEDMSIRARHLLLVLLFAPLDRIVELVQRWSRGAEKPRTHDEYRLPLLAFLGIPEDEATIVAEAAESLWSRQVALLESGDRPQARSDAAARYRFLLRFASRFARQWEGWVAHAERLNRIAGASSLLESRARTSSVSAALRDVVAELEQGWLYGSTGRPRGLAEAWQFARLACDRGEARDAPFGLLLLLSLVCDGVASIETHYPLLLDAWHQEALDAEMLLEMIAARVGEARFSSFNTGRTTSETPLVQHERGLAALASWLFDRIDEEEKESPLRAASVRLFVPALRNWLLQTEVASVRENLLHIVMLLTRWGSEEGPQLVRSWVTSRLDARRTDERLRIPDVRPTAGEPLLDREQMRLLLARAASGGGYQTDVEEYLFRWADHPSMDDRLVRELAADVAQWLESETHTFEWIARAARVHASRRLTAEVVQRLPVAPFGNIGSYVVARLRSLGPHEVGLWAVKRSAFFDMLAVFGPELSADDRRALREMVDVPALTADGRNGAAILAARMLDSRSEDADEWRAILDSAIEAGATGWGRLAQSLQLLTPEQSRRLQNNLLTTLARRKDLPNTDIVEWMGLTIDCVEGRFPDLEAELCSLLIAEQRPFALAAASVLMKLYENRPEVIVRNADRVERARVVLKSRDRVGRFRATSAFLRNLEFLSSAIAVPLSKSQ